MHYLQILRPLWVENSFVLYQPLNLPIELQILQLKCPP
jgi:hypothetical protein